VPEPCGRGALRPVATLFAWLLPGGKYHHRDAPAPELPAELDQTVGDPVAA